MSRNNNELRQTQAEIDQELRGGVNRNGQFFETRIIVIPARTTESLTSTVMDSIDVYLRQYGIQVTGKVSQTEYKNMTSSRAIGRYITVKKSQVNALTKEIEETRELIKVGESKYTLFDIFASVKYCMVSMANTRSRDGENLVAIWIRTHSRLYNVLEEFMDMPLGVAQIISTRIRKPVYMLGMSPFSKSRDEFAMFRAGNRREFQTGRFLLTNIRDEYGIDIVDLMMAIERNSDITEALDEVRLLRAEFAEHKARIANLSHEIETNEVLRNKKNEKGESIVDILVRENENMSESLDSRFKAAAELVNHEPIGEIVYFKIDAISGKKVRTGQPSRMNGSSVSHGKATDDQI